MKKTFSKILTLALILSLTVGVLSGISVSAVADSNGSGVARALSDEGIVMLKNENNALPLKNGANVAIFGEGQHLRLYTATDFNSDNSMGAETLQKQHGYIPWGAGSSRALGAGGKDAAVDPLDAFNYAEKMGRITVYDDISQKYIDALESSSSDKSFVEYIPTESDYQGAVNAGVDTAIVVISRFDGECVDLPVSEWSLFDSEKSVLQNATKYFDKVIVVLNTPTPIDTSWAFEDDLGIEVDAILFAGYGGMQGGYAIADVVLGDVNPSGKLVTTYAKDLYDYPTTESFINDSSMQKYTEDIFLGYRYFETFDPTYSKVNFEFGFGLSYTTFKIETGDFKVENGKASVKAVVTNTGDVAGKEVVQMYLSAPQGKLGKAAKVLCAFDKTELLAPGASETLILSCDLEDLASYDDLGKTGNKSAYVLEAGDYKFYVGNSVKEAGTRLAGTHTLSELQVVEQLSEQAKTNLDKRLLADGTFENLQTGEEEEIGVIKVEAEAFIEVGSTAGGSSNPKTETINGTLYDPETDTWNSYTGGTALSNTSYSGAYTIYKINAEKAGYYNLTMRGANHASKTKFTVTASVSYDGTVFEGAITSPEQTLKNPDTSKKWNNHFDFDFGNCVKFQEGENYIKLTFTDSPNLDFFTFTLVENALTLDASVKVEAESFFEASGHTTESFTGFIYEEGQWKNYTGSSLGSTYKGPATYRVFVGETGYYKLSFRMSKHLQFAEYSISVATSSTNSSFATVSDTGAQTLTKQGYYSFIDAPCAAWVKLNEGYNYIKLTFTGAPNVDFFTVTGLNYVPENAIKVEGESFDTSLSAQVSTEVSGDKCNLYNEADGLWYPYSSTHMNNTWKGKAVYVVDVEKGGIYSVGMRAARHANASYATYTVTVKTSTTTTFAGGITSPVIDRTNPAYTSSYHSFSDFVFADTVELKKGVNYIELSYTGNPNIDFFTLTLQEEKTEIYVPEEKDEYYQLKDVVSGEITMDEFVEQMTNEELATFFVSYSGYNFGGSDEVNAKYGFLRVAFSDGPSGIGSRATSFPCETVIACTFNTDLVEAFGRVIGKELYDNNIDFWAAPGVNLHRNPLSGRNSEYYSEDPFLSGVMAVTTIKAVQQYGVNSCIKHFVCNEKETNKLAQDVRVSERALREIYLKPFEMAVKDANVHGVMSSYNIVNGVAMSENRDILVNILRDEWGYDFYISGDWNNNKDMIKEINAGHGVREPYSYCDIDTVIAAVNDGEISRETLLTGAKYELNSLMHCKRNYSKWTDEVCNGSHSYVDNVCSKCHAPSEAVFADHNEAIDGLVDNMVKNVGFKATVLESTMTAEKGTIRHATYTNKLNTLNTEKNWAELTIYNTMASKETILVKMGVYVNDANVAWPRITVNDKSYQWSGTEGVYKHSDEWLAIPYGETATLWYDLTDSKYDTYVGTKGTYTRSDYTSIVYIYAKNCQAGDFFYLKGEGMSSSASTQLGMSIENVSTDIAFNSIADYNVVKRLEGDYGVSLDTSVLDDSGLTAVNGKFFDGKVEADYILKATDSADYIFKGWYDYENNLISTEKLHRYNTLDVLPKNSTVYAQYVKKDAKAFTNTIQGASVDIGASLTVNYYADLDEAHKDAVLSVTRNGGKTELYGVKDGKTGMYIFSYEGINPQCMADNLKAELIFENEVISEKAEYSIKAYAQNQLLKTAGQIGVSEEKAQALKTLLSDMLLYGDEAQDYMKYNQQEYATENVEGLVPSLYSAPENAVKRVVSGNTDTENRVSGCGLNMSNVNRIYFSVNAADAEIYLDNNLVTADGNGRVYTDAIKAYQFENVHTLTLKKGNEVVAEVEYNVNAYITAKSEDATVGEIVKALNNYGAAAKAYASTN